MILVLSVLYMAVNEMSLKESQNEICWGCIPAIEKKLEENTGEGENQFIDMVNVKQVCV
jgi:hypothetical protein